MIRRLLYWVSGLLLLASFGLVMQIQPMTLHANGYADERAEQYVWKTLKTGAGGWITGIDISADGSVVVGRTDVGGAYRWNETTLSWTQIVTADSMPDESYRGFGGVMSIVTAPSKAQRLYMAFNGSIYRSNDAGGTWTKTALTGLNFNANAHYRQQGERLAVHPTDPNLVYFGSPDFTSPQQGLYKSTDGGATWTTVPLLINNAEINAANINIGNVDFDSQGRAYATVDGYGVFRANQAGVWSHISKDANNPNGPDWAIYQQMDISNDGTVYFVLNKPYTPGNPGDPLTSSEIWRFRDNSWQKLNPPAPYGGGFSTIAVSPGDSKFVIAFSFGGRPYRSYDSGNSWDQWDSLRAKLGYGADIPWFDTTAKDWISVSNIVFDPVVPNRLWLGEGTGAWRTTDLFDNEIEWKSVSKGIEELVSNDVIAPAGGKVVTAHWDWASFYHENVDAYPAMQSTYGRFNSTWDLDYSAGTPSFVVGVITDQRYCCYEDGKFNMSGYSQDGGRNWQKFANIPTGMEFGNIAVAANDTQNIVWVPSSDQVPQYTKDRGNSWTPITLDVPADQAGSHNDPHLNRRVITADRVLPNTFYYYHKDNGVYRSTDGGASWTRMANTGGLQGFPFGYYGVIMESVPGRQGHLWMTTGIQTGASYPLKRSNDGGASWNSVPGVENVTSFGFGKAATANGYPAVYIQGVVNGDPGVYRSINGGDSWLKLAAYPLGSFDIIKAVSGDMNIFGRVYLGTAGSGFIYGDSTDVAPPPTNTPGGQTPVPTTPTPEGAFTELLINTDLETDTNGDKVPDMWKAKDNEPASGNKLKCKAGEDHAYSGSCAYRFKGNANGSKSKLTFKASNPVLPNVVTYDFSGHFMSNNLTTAMMVGKAKIVFTDGSAESIELYPLSSGTGYNTGHTTSAFNRNGRTPQTLKVQFFYASANGKLWLDDVSFKVFENGRDTVIGLP